MQPAVRGTFTKFLWRSVKRLDGIPGEVLRATFPTALRQRIRDAPRFGWSEGALFAETLETVHNLGGRPASLAMWHRCCIDCMDLPLVRPLAQGAVTLFGTVPRALVMRTPQLWALITRECGHMRAEPHGQEQRIGFQARGLPPILRIEALLAMFEAGFQAQLDVLGYEGDVSVDASRLAFGDVGCEIVWSQPRALHEAPSD